MFTKLLPGNALIKYATGWVLWTPVAIILSIYVSETKLNQKRISIAD
jgi:hypothetical protein